MVIRLLYESRLREGNSHSCLVSRITHKMFRCTQQNCTMAQYFIQPFAKPGKNVFSPMKDALRHQLTLEHRPTLSTISATNSLSHWPPHFTRGPCNAASKVPRASVRART